MDLQQCLTISAQSLRPCSPGPDAKPWLVVVTPVMRLVELDTRTRMWEARLCPCLHFSCLFEL